MILYRTANYGGEYNRLYAFMRREGYTHKLGWPVVVAEEDGRVIGFLGTTPADDAIWAGPLVIENGRKRPFVFLRLVEAYENVLRACGVQAYVFAADKDNEGYINQVRRLGIHEIGEDERYRLFMRTI